MKNWKVFKILKALYMKLVRDEITAISAQVTYYLILAFFPFLIFVVTLISYTNLTAEDSISVLSNFLPTSVYMLITDIIKNVAITRSRAFISLGMLATIWSASVGILAFMYGFNKAYKQKETRPFWKIRVLSIVFTIVLSVIILISFMLVVFGEIIGNNLLDEMGFSDGFKPFWDVFRYVVSTATIFVVLILFYNYIPNRRLSIRDVIPGAVLSTLGWILLSLAFAFYVNNFVNYSRIYGSIGAIIALLIWLYWSSIIIFTGSELNAILLEYGNR